MLVTIFLQGSILRPLLFNIFINNIFLFVEKSDTGIFPDNNAFFSFRDNLSVILRTLRHDIKINLRWFSTNLRNLLQPGVAYLYPLKTSENL